MWACVHVLRCAQCKHTLSRRQFVRPLVNGGVSYSYPNRRCKQKGKTGNSCRRRVRIKRANVVRKLRNNSSSISPGKLYVLVFQFFSAQFKIGTTLDQLWLVPSVCDKKLLPLNFLWKRSSFVVRCYAASCSALNTLHFASTHSNGYFWGLPHLCFEQ